MRFWKVLRCMHVCTRALAFILLNAFDVSFRFFQRDFNYSIEILYVLKQVIVWSVKAVTLFQEKVQTNLVLNRERVKLRPQKASQLTERLPIKKNYNNNERTLHFPLFQGLVPLGSPAQTQQKHCYCEKQFCQWTPRQNFEQ